MWKKLSMIKDNKKSVAILNALKTDQPQKEYGSLAVSILAYAKKLALAPHELLESDLSKMRKEGLGDGEILEVNQVVSYFCYANRTVLGLGVTTKGDVLGLSPNDQTDDNNWSHN